MEIKLARPHHFIDKQVEKAALDAGCWARIRWWRAEGCRFVLVNPNTNEAATFEQHDRVIASLFMQHPDALVRTAIATYRGAAEFELQRKGRVA